MIRRMPGGVRVGVTLATRLGGHVALRTSLLGRFTHHPKTGWNLLRGHGRHRWPMRWGSGLRTSVLRILPAGRKRRSPPAQGSFAEMASLSPLRGFRLSAGVVSTAHAVGQGLPAPSGAGDSRLTAPGGSSSAIRWPPEPWGRRRRPPESTDPGGRSFCGCNPSSVCRSELSR
jgi:hypothetical protein